MMCQSLFSGGKKNHQSVFWRICPEMVKVKVPFKTTANYILTFLLFSQEAKAFRVLFKNSLGKKRKVLLL